MSELKTFVSVFIGILIGFSSCSSGAATAVQEEGETAAVEASAQQDIGFPIYESFEEVAPIFQQQSDTTYVINFWATWCKPCVKELPYFEALHENFKGEKIKVILVSLDFKKDVEPKLIPFVEEHKLKSDVIALTDHKYNEWIDRVDPDWGGAIPVTVVYKQDQREFIGESFANQEELFALVQKML
ncbi:MAG: TlpA family protein disulfide reductase [Saprospiraceae bacterium]|nr:TlpA family protein disulfide reductase [Saprospiraceae bacterium]